MLVCRDRRLVASSRTSRRRSSGELSAGGGLPCGLPDGRAPDPKDGGGGSGVDLEIPDELIETHAVGKPVEQLLDGQPRVAKAGGPAHSARVDPDGFLKRHGCLGLGSGQRLHGAG